MSLPLIFEQSAPGAGVAHLPELDVPAKPVSELIPAEAQRQQPATLPEVDELTLVRHFLRLSQQNFSVDTNFYPLGSCTMKYNPKVNELVAALPGFARLHPLQPAETVQGILGALYRLQQHLADIAGMHAASLQPAAGAQGEFVGMLIIRAWHDHRGQGDSRRKILAPDSAHGTNPASAARCGFDVITLESGADGCVDLAALEEAVGEDTAGMMLTNPNTFGLFEKDICRITEIVHDAGGLVYYDGANANAILGRARPGDMGCDVGHFNLHKTFSTPHGGGGPGCGPVVVTEDLEPFLPAPVIVKRDGLYLLDDDRPLSVGRVHGFHGNVGIAVRALAYIMRQGADGLAQTTDHAVLNANYLLSQLDARYVRPHGYRCMHEFVVSASRLRHDYDIRALDVAKRLIDLGFHPPTVYFPMVEPEALMVEPTETESPATLDAFAAALNQIAQECETAPDRLHQAPVNTPVTRLDETRAARQPELRWRASASEA